MAYEKLKLCNAMMSGEIYLARESEKGLMSTTNRRVITDEVLRSAADWFLSNERNGAKWESIDEETHPHLFFTADIDKAKRILAILEENNDD